MTEITILTILLNKQKRLERKPRRISEGKRLYYQNIEKRALIISYMVYQCQKVSRINRKLDDLIVEGNLILLSFIGKICDYHSF